MQLPFLLLLCAPLLWCAWITVMAAAGVPLRAAAMQACRDIAGGLALALGLWAFLLCLYALGGA